LHRCRDSAFDAIGVEGGDLREYQPQARRHGLPADGLAKFSVFLLESVTDVAAARRAWPTYWISRGETP